MGAERAITVSQRGSVRLGHFHDEIVAKMELVDEGKWLLVGRVGVANLDGDNQDATAPLLHDANAVIDEITLYMPGDNSMTCICVEAGFLANGRETITLVCNTYDGFAQQGAFIAFKVDDIDFQ